MTDKKKILVIDDDKNVGAILKIKLEKLWSYHVIFADDGNKGIEIAKKEQPDLIVLDIQMPGLDGADVRIELESESKTRSIPVLFLTSMMTAEESRASRGLVGGRPMISKKLSIGEIVSHIETFLATAPQETK